MNKTGSSYFNHCPCETETQTDETLDKLNKENIEICDKISNLTNTLNDPKKVDKGFFSKAYIDFQIKTNPCNLIVRRQHAEFVWLRERLSVIFNTRLLK